MIIPQWSPPIYVYLLLILWTYPPRRRFISVYDLNLCAWVGSDHFYFNFHLHLMKTPNKIYVYFNFWNADQFMKYMQNIIYQQSPLALVKIQFTFYANSFDGFPNRRNWKPFSGKFNCFHCFDQFSLLHHRFVGTTRNHKISTKFLCATLLAV